MRPLLASCNPRLLPGVFKRLLTSAFLCTLVALFSFNWILERINPLEILFFTGMTSIRQNNMVSKLPKIINSRDDNNILLLGTSLSLYPMLHLDDLKTTGKTRWDDTYVRYKCCPYQKADYLREGLEKKLNHPLTLTNASVVGAIMADQYLILDKYLKSGKRPEVVILFTAPRDFMLNNASSIGKSPTFEILADHHNFYEVISSTPDFRTLLEFGIGQIFPYYKARRDYKGLALSATNRLAGRVKIGGPNNNSPKVVNIFDVDRFWEAEAIYDQPPNVLRERDYYQKSYNPLNRNRIENQKKYFTQLIKNCTKNGIKLVIVDTPLPMIHYNLIPKEGLSAYRKILAEGCSTPGVVLVNPGKDTSYDLEDFEDVAHLNLRGARKLCRHLFDVLDEDTLQLSPQWMIGRSKARERQL